MSKQVDPKKPVTNPAKATTPAQPAQPKPAQGAAPKNPVAEPRVAKKPDTQAPVQAKPVDPKAAPAKAVPAKPTDAKVAPAKAVPAKPTDAKAAPVKPTDAKAQPAAPQKPTLHSDIDKIVVDATKGYEHKKTSKTEIVHEVKEVKIAGDDKKQYTALVVYLPFVYYKNHKGLLSKIVNDIQSKKKLPTFLVAQRTLINKKSDFKQKISRNRTLTSVYDSILEDLISPGTIIGKRQRYHLDGSQHNKIFLNEESKAFLENKTTLITQIYKQLTNRKVTFEFRPEINFIKVPLIKSPRAKPIRKAAPKKDNAAVAAQ